MDEMTERHLRGLRSGVRAQEDEAFMHLVAMSDVPVDWAYDAWDDLVADLRHPQSHRRAIAAQVLANLARSDPEGRMARDFERLLAVTRDERTVTARHALQAIWKVGLAGEPQRRMVIDGLARRFAEAGSEKNGTLTRFDISQGLRHLYEASGDEAARERALALIETETDEKYRKKYAAVWRRKKG